MTADQKLDQDRILVLGNFTGDTPPERDWSRVVEKALVDHGWETDVQSREIEAERLNVSERTAAVILDTSPTRGLTDPRKGPSAVELVRGLRDGLRDRGLATPILAASWVPTFNFVRETSKVGAGDWFYMDLNPEGMWRNMVLPDSIVYDRRTK